MIQRKNGRCSLTLVTTIQMLISPVLISHQSTQLSLLKAKSKSVQLFESYFYYFRFLVLRHREYNGDISLVSKIDLQGRLNDATEAPKLGSFSFVTEFLSCKRISNLVVHSKSRRLINN